MKYYITLLSMFFSFVVSAQDNAKRAHVVQRVKAKNQAAARGSSPEFTEVPSTDSVYDDSTCSCGCEATFDNYTGYWINVYVDSVFKGVVEPYAVGELWIHPGSKLWYAETVGSTYYWSGALDCIDDHWIKFLPEN